MIKKTTTAKHVTQKLKVSKRVQAVVRLGIQGVCGLFLILGVVSPAQAYVRAVLSQDVALKGYAPTHVVVAGTSDEEGDLFIQAALTRARRYVELYPKHQVLVISTRDRKNGDLTNGYTGVKVVHSDDHALTSDVLIKTLVYFRHIRSLDFYGHAVLDRGFNIDDGYRLLPSSSGIERLKRNFDREAYATFHACNTGFKLAPELSRIWGIPVAGMLTGSDFQVLHSDNQWYFNNANESPAGVTRAKVNERSFGRPVGCEDGGCVRMMPTNSTYKGKLGEFGAGLGFMKFFCNYEQKLIPRLFDRNRCVKNMALALVSQPTSANPSLKSSGGKNSARTFLYAATEFLCPANANGKNVACMRALMDSLHSGNPVYSSMRRPDGESVLQCTLKGCNFGYEHIGKGYKVWAPANPQPTTQVGEFWNYVRGYNELQ